MLIRERPLPGVVVADTCVLLNFLRIDRMDLIGAHPDAFMATDHVAVEITDPPQRERYEDARRAGLIAEENVTDPAEVETFLRLEGSGRLGAGERSAIAVARNRGYRLATDDSKAIQWAAREAVVATRELRFVRTEGIVTELIEHGALTIATADEMLADWAANHRFRRNFSSFRTLMIRERPVPWVTVDPSRYARVRPS